MKVFKFYPGNKAKFHFGDSKAKLKSDFSSDQLFSAIFNNLVTFFGVKEDIKEELKRIKFSSLFYGIKISKKNGASYELFFLPCPLAPIKKRGEKPDLRIGNLIKKIEFLSFAAFEHLIKTWDNEEKFFDFDLSRLEVIEGRFACLPEELQFSNLTLQDKRDIELFTQEAKPRVTVLRNYGKAEAHNFYYQEEIEVNYNGIDDYMLTPFMYFICDGEISTNLRAAIRLMADEGLGGKRSLGMGLFDKVLEEDWNKDIFAEREAPYYLNLSCVFPQREEAIKAVYYKLTERSGYIHSQQGKAFRKKRARLFKEGSIFKAKISGELLDLSPDWFDDHEVFLDGRAFLIPIGEVG